MSSFVFPDTSKLICLAAEIIYGDADDWMLMMASDLGVRTDTISQWAKARRTPPRAVIEQLRTMLHEKMAKAARFASQIDSALPRMLCPECSANLKVIQSPNGRTIDCENGHHFMEESGAPFGPYAEKKFVQVPRFAKRGTIVVGRNPNNITFELSRDVLPADRDALLKSFNDFTDRLGLQRGRVTASGRRMQALLRDNLVGRQSRELRDWFENECNRIDNGG
jgi:hypothetical protein